MWCGDMEKNAVLNQGLEIIGEVHVYIINRICNYFKYK